MFGDFLNVEIILWIMTALCVRSLTDLIRLGLLTRTFLGRPKDPLTNIHDYNAMIETALYHDYWIIDLETSDVHYILKDNLGSWTVATVHGSTVERLSYDPWGRRRNPVILRSFF